MLTEPTDLHYTELENFKYKLLIMNSTNLLGSLKYVITIILWIRYMGCYNPLP
jgi:hypothetical protein